MTSYVFPKIQLAGRKAVPCSGGCGRKVRRQQTFYQTLNPFNKNTEGIQKSSQEIFVELRERITAWQGEPETCRECAA